MPEHSPQPERVRGDLPPALQEMRHMLEWQRMMAALAPEIDGSAFDALARSEVSDAVIAEVQRDIIALNAALVETNGVREAITPADCQNMQELGVKLARLSLTLLRERERRRAESEAVQNENVDAVTQKVSKEYGAPWLQGIVADAKITDLSENKEAPVRASPLSEELKGMVRKKVLVDLYVQGRSLTALGGFWAYHSELPWKETANDRAMSAALRLTNTVTAFVLAKSGLSLDYAMEAAGEEGVQRLGNMRLSFDEAEDGAAQGQLHLRGQTPSELAHEMIKGLLEYVVSDTSLPAEGEITREEAQQLKTYLERPATEIFEGIYGPAIARNVDDAWAALLKTSKADRTLEERLRSLLGFTGDESLADERVYLRFIKVFSMLDTEQLAQFYDHCIRGEIPREFLSTMEAAKDRYDA